MAEEQPGEAEGHRTPLDRIVDDTEERDAAREWIAHELLAGRPPEELVHELMTSGWGRDDAELMVEAGRKQTRGERGVVTREEVAQALQSRYRSGMAAGWMAGVPLLATVRRLIYAASSWMALRRVSGEDRKTKNEK